MHRRIKTVKNQVTLIMVLFSAVVSALIIFFGVYLVISYQRQITIQGTEVNLRLVANLIEQDLNDMARIGWASGNERVIADYFSADTGNDRIMAINAHDRMTLIVQNNRVGHYVRRLLVVSNDNTKILQMDNFSGLSIPVDVYNISLIHDLGYGEWFALIADPFHATAGTRVLPLVYPVNHPVNHSTIGTVTLLANSALITDKLLGYYLPENAALYLELGGDTYRIEGNAITPAFFDYTIIEHNITASVSPMTTVSTARGENSIVYTLVSYPIRDGISITQISPRAQFDIAGGIWIWLLIGVIATIVLTGILVIHRLGRTISRPIARLRQKIDAIAGGDFSQDPSLEFSSDLGVIGQGVNRLSSDIVVLMDTRIKDEQLKRDLEYRMLQSQITPHFLYNTLNSIKWMATLQSADGIAEMVTSLSRLLRTISKDIRKVAVLEDELTLLDDYLVIQKYRYRNSVMFTNTIDPEFMQTMVPRFSLQPLVENAIFHGIQPKGQGTITLSAEHDGDDVLVTVTDDGVGMSEDLINEILDGSPESDLLVNLGLRNVHWRLQYAFGVGYGLSIKSEAGKFTAMTLRLPGTGESPVRDNDAAVQ